MKIYGRGNDTTVEITELIDRIFAQDMQDVSGADEKYCKELLGKTASRLKEDLGLYIDLKLEMCSHIIES